MEKMASKDSTPSFCRLFDQDAMRSIDEPTVILKKRDFLV